MARHVYAGRAPGACDGTKLEPRTESLLVCTDRQVLFGEPVYRACLTACLMALHERLGAHSMLALLETEILRDVCLNACQDRLVPGACSRYTTD